MSTGFIVIIPARYDSKRLPGKPLIKIGGKTLIEHVYLSAISSHAGEVIIATDDERINETARSFNARVIMTSHEHASGTDRIQEAVEILKLDDKDIVVNLQGDEFGMDSELINTVARVLCEHDNADMSSLCVPIKDKNMYQDPNTVKVILDNDNFALYFSRAPIPWDGSSRSLFKTDVTPLKHIGIYAYSAGFLRTYTGLMRPQIETIESLEQLRALYHGYKIYVETVPKKAGVEINTETDLEEARKLIG